MHHTIRYDEVQTKAANGIEDSSVRGRFKTSYEHV